MIFNHINFFNFELNNLLIITGLNLSFKNNNFLCLIATFITLIIVYFIIRYLYIFIEKNQSGANNANISNKKTKISSSSRDSDSSDDDKKPPKKKIRLEELSESESASNSRSDTQRRGED